MLPLPRAAIFGASAATRKYAAPDVGGEEPVEGRHVEVRGRPEPGEAGVVDQHVDRAGLLDEVVQLGRVAEVGRHEAGLAALGGDRVDHRGAAAGVPSVHDELGAVPAEFFGRSPADARRCPGNQGNHALQVPLVVHLSSFQTDGLVMP